MIDWDATGSMLQGWATLAGAGAVIYAAVVGKGTFDDWRKQRQEERRMDAAERILTLAYLLRYNLNSVRVALTSGQEMDTAEQDLDAALPGWSAAKTDAEKRRIKIAQTIFNRLKRHNEDWQRIWTLKPVARAFFGPEIEDALHVFWTQQVTISIAAEAYAEDDDSDKEYSKGLRTKLFGTGNDADDAIAGAVNDAIAKLEAELQPILRSSGRT